MSIAAILHPAPPPRRGATGEAPRRLPSRRSSRMAPRQGLRRRLARFARDERGAISVLNLFLFMASACLAGAAVDVTHFMSVRAQLQVAADVAAHTALVRRSRGATPAQARADAVAMASFGMPSARFGAGGADILFGAYDPATDTFRVDETSDGAVLVTAGQTRAGGNALPTFFFRMAGIGQMDVVAAAAAITEQPACLTEGLTAETLVDVRSMNVFRSGFCIHSNDRLELNNGNTVEPGAVVSLPDLADLTIPASGFDQNPGLEAALRQNWFALRILDRLRPGSADPLDAAILEPGNLSRPAYLGTTAVGTIAVGGNNTALTPSSFLPGQVHRASCGTNQRLTLQPAPGQTQATFSRFVLLTDCEIQISGKVTLDEVVLYTTNTGTASIKVNSGGGGESGLLIGREDACAPGGGAQVVTRGGVGASAKLTMNGGQILALGNVSFAAQAFGRGASIVSGGTISGTSLMDFGGCGTGMEGNLTATYVRLAR